LHCIKSRSEEVCGDIQETGIVALAHKPIGLRWYCRCILRH